ILSWGRAKWISRACITWSAIARATITSSDCRSFSRGPDGLEAHFRARAAAHARAGGADQAFVRRFIARRRAFSFDDRSAYLSCKAAARAFGRFVGQARAGCRLREGPLRADFPGTLSGSGNVGARHFSGDAEICAGRDSHSRGIDDGAAV